MQFSLKALILILRAVSIAGQPVFQILRSRSENEPVFSLAAPGEALASIYVTNMDEAAMVYPEIFGNPASGVVLILKDSNTFLVRAETGTLNSRFIGPTENLDSIQAAGFRDTLIGIADNFVGDHEEPEKKKEEQDTEWVEHFYADTKTQEYPGYIPISGCQSQVHGQSGSVSFSYSFGGSIGTNSNIGISYTAMMITASLSAGLSVTETFSVGGTTSCAIPAGKVGQIMLKPDILSVVPLSRRVRWLAKAQRFMTDGDFVKYDPVHILLSLNTFQVNCATNDKVELFCDGTRLGIPDWDNPLGIGYDDLIGKR